ncbi:hypothetical protein [Rhizorhabdus dicambivorans]|uniref:Uncharacterized protein n=1 Tax=Rhizorhabdus dicambivorans TaxID=1850238 RepID=A0A2A4FTR2_9SPHN|nr:hypothetical protein [Rhizorhabdus dicambivorans]ATE66791.1 hypothetical protein CMV14_22220 [Rhizorhabdus dicambivorans]PCE40781.1 hypothetical protein COO09_18155 [Rhizorhabdus dicambivorans]
MADYYTPTVVEPVIPLSAVLPVEDLFLGQVFDEDVENGIVYYFSEDGARDLVFFDPKEVRDALDNSDHSSSRLVAKLLDEYAEALRGDDEFEFDMAGDLWPDVLQDIVRRSPDLQELTVTMAFTCSKMRPDGFGGLAMLITASAIRSESTHTLFDRFYKEAAANGEIRHGDS